MALPQEKLLDIESLPQLSVVEAKMVCEDNRIFLLSPQHVGSFPEEDMGK